MEEEGRRIHLSEVVFRKRCFKVAAFGVTMFIFLTMVVFMRGGAIVEAKEIKDEINHLSFSYDGKKVIFDRCRDESCQIQVYDLETGELSAYQSPPNERWTMARQSYDGKKIVFSVIPAGEKYLDLTQMQIAVMDVDGKNYKKLTSSPFPKIYPTFSHSGKKILYVKAGWIRKHGRTPASSYDAWEVDVETGNEVRLTYFEYMQMNSLFYFPGDETILYNAAGPFAFPGLVFLKDEEGRFKDLEAAMKMIAQESEKRNVPLWGILTIKKGELFPKRPYSLFEEGHPPINPILSKDGTKLYFEAAAKAGDFFLYSPDGNHKFIVKGGSAEAWALSPDGELLAICYRESFNIKSVKDGSPYHAIVLPWEARRSPDWDDEMKKTIGLRMLPEMPSRIIGK